MWVPAALGVLLLELSVVRLGAACDVPEGHTDPEVISPVKHQPSGGYVKKSCEEFILELHITYIYTKKKNTYNSW